MSPEAETRSDEADGQLGEGKQHQGVEEKAGEYLMLSKAKGWKKVTTQAGRLLSTINIQTAK